MFGEADKNNGTGRTPQGVRGLKLPLEHQIGSKILSHPARGAWIEIGFENGFKTALRSHPARGAWIEIMQDEKINEILLVAPRKGCVD